MGIPHLYSCIITGRGDAFPIRRPGHIAHRATMAPIGKERLASGGIPHLYGVTIAGGGEELPIRRPGYALYIGIVLKGEERLASGGIPHLYSCIIASRSDVFS